MREQRASDVRWDFRFGIYSTINRSLKPPYTGTGYSNTKLRIMHVYSNKASPSSSHDFSFGFLTSESGGKLWGLRSYRFSSLKMPNRVPSCKRPS